MDLIYYQLGSFYEPYSVCRDHPFFKEENYKLCKAIFESRMASYTPDDVAFIFQNGTSIDEVHTNRYRLTGLSPVFCKLFRYLPAMDVVMKVKDPDLDAETFKLIVRIFHTEGGLYTTTDYEKFPLIIGVMEKYRMVRAKEGFIRYIEDKFSEEKLREILREAHRITRGFRQYDASEISCITLFSNL